jgi:hypothetical protein
MFERSIIDDGGQGRLYTGQRVSLYGAAGDRSVAKRFEGPVDDWMNGTELPRLEVA